MINLEGADAGADGGTVESLHLLRTLLQTTRQGYWFIDLQGLTTDVNPAMCSMLGRARELILGRSVFDFFKGEDLLHLEREIEARRQGKTGAYEIAITRPDGSRVFCLNTATPLFDTRGRPVGSAGIWTDISERRRIEDTLHIYEQVANSVTERVSVIGEDGSYRMVNDEWCRRTGLAREQVIGRHAEALFPDQITAERRRAMRECIEQQRHAVVRDEVTIFDVSARILETRYYPYTEKSSGLRCAVLVTRDITEQETSRRQLAISAEYLRGMLNATGDAIFASDATAPDQALRFVNQQMLQMWGIPASKLDTLTQGDVIAATRRLVKDPEGEAQRVLEILAAKQPHESHLALADGRVLLQRFVPAVVGDHAFRVWSFRDVSAEQRALRLAQANEAQQRAVLDAFPGFITRIDASHVYTYANRRVARRLGTTPEGMVGRPVRDVLGDEIYRGLQPLLVRALAGETVVYERHHEANEEGELINQVTLQRGTDPASGRPVVYAFGFDITDRKRAEQQLLAASRELELKTQALQITLDNMEQGIVSVDAQGCVRFCNRRALVLLELPDEVLHAGGRVGTVFDYQTRRGDIEADGTVIDVEGRRVAALDDGPTDYVRRTRAGRLLEVRARPTEGGGWVRTYTDVTAYVQAQQALRNSEAELRALLDAFPGYIAAMDQDHRYTYVNDRLTALFERPVPQVVGAHMREVLGDARFEANRAEMVRAQSGAPSTSERGYPATAQRGAIELQVTHVAGPLRPDGRQFYYVFGIDITARKRAEAALMVARDEADRANAAKSEFLSRMSHELRTPLNAILGFSELLGFDQNLAATQRRWVSEIAMGGRHLLLLINDVLDLARVESGHFSVSPEPVALWPVVDECLALLKPQADARAVQLPATAAAGVVMVHADRTRLKQVLLNLLSNAIKYNRPGGHIDVDCLDDGPTLRIAVRDEGPGLTPEQQARLFVPFERLDADKRQIEGTGIGLALSKRLLELMGGRMGVVSRPGHGSTFWFELPRAAANAGIESEAAPLTALPAAAAGSTPSWRHQVLYIEDNPANLRLVEGILASRADIRLLGAMAPSLGLELARQYRPDLILLDINLPDMDGYDVLRSLREHAATREIPVLALSASAMPRDIERGIAAGFVDYLVKPISVASLVAAVERWLGR